MTLSLNHFSVRTVDMPSSKKFYEDVLGMSAGPRPNFDFPGHWMYVGSHDSVANAVVHIIGMDLNDPEGLKKYLGDRDVSSLKGSGAVDHIAFFATGMSDKVAHLKALAIEHRIRTVPSIGLHQVFITDPNGVVIELNYPATETY